MNTLRGKNAMQISLVMSPFMQWVIEKSLGHKPDENESFFWYVDHKLSAFFAWYYRLLKVLNYPIF